MQPLQRVHRDDAALGVHSGADALVELEAWILNVSVAHGGALTVASGGLGGRERRRAGQQHLLDVRERRGRREQRRRRPTEQRASHCRVCGISGSVAESGSSCTGA